MFPRRAKIFFGVIGVSRSWIWMARESTNSLFRRPSRKVVYDEAEAQRGCPTNADSAWNRGRGKDSGRRNADVIERSGNRLGLEPRSLALRSNLWVLGKLAIAMV